LLGHLLKIGRTPDAGQKAFEDLAVATAANKLGDYLQFSKFKKKSEDPEVSFLADFLRRNTREIDKKHYLVTFRQLDTILRRYGVSLEDPQDNHINVIREVEKSSFFGMKKKRERTRIAQVGFPGWKREVTQPALKTIRRAAGLTHERGIDSQVLFKGADPLQALIGQYHGPLERLKDK
jgi:hypothetical protein